MFVESTTEGMPSFSEQHTQYRMDILLTLHLC